MDMFEFAGCFETASNVGEFFSDAIPTTVVLRAANDDQKLMIGTGYGNEATMTFSNLEVGVGIATPESKLHVHRSDNTTTTVKITNSTTGTGSGDGLDLSMVSSNTVLQNNENGNITLNTNGTTGNAILTSTGDFGVGLATPQEKLHLHDTGASTNTGVQFTNGTTTDASGRGLLVGLNNTNEALIMNREDAKMDLGTNNIVAMTITGSNVGIGTNNPTSIFHVQDSVGGTVAKFENTSTGDASIDIITTGTGAGSVRFDNGTNNSSITHETNGDMSFNVDETNEVFRITPTSEFQLSNGSKISGDTLTFENTVTDGTTTFQGPGNPVFNFKTTDTDTAYPTISLTGARSADTTNDVGEVRFENYDNDLTSSNIIGSISAVVSNSTTNNEGSLHFKTADAGTNSTKMVLDKDGQLGIGTTTPTRTIQLHDPIVTGIPRVHFTNGTTGTTTSDGVEMGITGSSQMLIMNRENNDMFFGTNNTERMRIDNNGLVGVGTTNPVEIMHLHESGAADTRIQLTNDTTGATTGDGVSFGIRNGSEAVIIQKENADLSLWTANTQRVTVKNDGDVGIGTATPSQKFHTYQTTTGNIAKFETTAVGAGRVVIETGTGGTPALRLVEGSDQAQIDFDSDELTLSTNVNGTINFETAGSPEFNFRSSELSGETSTVNIIGARNANTTEDTAILNFNNYDNDITSENTLATIAARVTNDGTNNAGSLRFYTANVGAPAERLIIEDNGDIGIGTSNPGVKVHVHEPTGNPRLQFTNNTTGTNTGDGLSIGIRNNTEAVIIQREADDLSLWTNDTQRLTINSGGDVGINTTTIDAKLHVYRGANGIISKFQSSATGGSAGGVTVETGNNGEAYLELTDGTNSCEIRNDGGTMEFRSGTTQVMTMDSNSLDMASGTDIRHRNGTIDNINSNGSLTIQGGGSYDTLFRTTSTNGENCSITIQGARTANTTSDIAHINFQNFDNDITNTTTLARISMRVDDTGDNDDGDLVFQTAAGGTLNERMRIKTGGFIGMGTDVPRNNLHIHEDGTATTRIQLTNGDTTSGTNRGTEIGLRNGKELLIMNRENDIINFGTNNGIRASMDQSGNISANGWIRGNAVGQVLNMVALDSVSLTNSVVNTTSFTDVIVYNYTRVSNSSKIVVDVDIDYVIGGAIDDTFESRIRVATTNTIVKRQEFRGSTVPQTIPIGGVEVGGQGTRSGVLAPIKGVYTNSATGSITIRYQARRVAADDNITYTTNNTLVITEIAN